jgi:stage V sporulation protein SpoVS
MKWNLWILLLIPALSYGEDRADINLQVALSYNFAKFTHWPESLAAEDLTFCYYNKDFAAGFQRLAGKKVAQSSIKIHRLTNLNDINGCQLVFLDQKSSASIQKLLLAARDKSVLTISDSKGFVGVGGMIELVTVGNLMKFKIDQTQLKRAGLDISAKVLKLALEVKQ